MIVIVVFFAVQIDLLSIGGDALDGKEQAKAERQDEQKAF